MGMSIIIVIVAVSLTIVSVGMAIFAYKMAVEAEKRAEKALNRAIETDTDLRNIQAVYESIMHRQECRIEEHDGRIKQLEALVPEDYKEERARRDVLMSQLNDEMEKRVRAEQEWNSMMNSVLNFNVKTGLNDANGGEN